MATSSFFETLESRKAQFWKQCLACAALHTEWPQDGVKDFFLWWTQTDSTGKMAFELEKKWGIGHRMNSYMKRRRFLNSYYDARLENARGKQRTKSLEQVRAEAQDAEAQSVYDRFFEGQGKEIREKRKREEEKN